MRSTLKAGGGESHISCITLHAGYSSSPSFLFFSPESEVCSALQSVQLFFSAIVPNNTRLDTSNGLLIQVKKKSCLICLHWIAMKRFDLGWKGKRHISFCCQASSCSTEWTEHHTCPRTGPFYCKQTQLKYQMCLISTLFTFIIDCTKQCNKKHRQPSSV